MNASIRNFTCVIVLLTASGLSMPLAAQQTPPAVERPYPVSSPPYGIAVKRPVFGGACMACPWGIMAIATMQALKPYGYDLQICWLCHSNLGPRQMADMAKPVAPSGTDFSRPDIAPVPDAVLDLAATSEVNLVDAWNGTGAYASDKKKRQNYRIVAALQQPNYLLAAASRQSGIRSLAEIKDRRRATWVYVDGNDATREVLAFYGITEEGLKARSGGLLTAGSREFRAAADVIIHNGLLVNTPEQRVWYEATQLSDLFFMDLDPKLIENLTKRPGYYAVTTPAYSMRGLDRRLTTVMRPTHVIYVRDDAPDDFVYTLAKALDEHQEVWRMQAEPFYYDTRSVAVSRVIPLHPAAARYYRERGYLK
jgi:TRAP transporter TAXI family solute receptor